MEEEHSAWGSSAVAPAGACCLRSILDDNTFLYGIFDTHNGSDYPSFILKQFSDGISSSTLANKNSDEEIKDLLRDTFQSAENAYTESIKDLVAERTSLYFDLPDDIKNEKLSKKHIEIIERLKIIDKQLSIGVTTVIALIHDNRLFVANIGNSRALLCKTDDNYVLRVVQLSVDHSLNNEDELLRLSQLGVDIKKMRENNMVGNQSSTRCLGNYMIKILFRAFPDLSNANSEPVLALPEVHGPINLDDSCRFLIMMSDKLYKHLEDSIETEQVNKQLAQMVVEQFRVQPTLEAVCKSTIDKITNLYYDHCVKSLKPMWDNSCNTLFIKNFNFLLPNAVIPVAKPVLKQKLIDTSSETLSMATVQSAIHPKMLEAKEEGKFGQRVPIHSTNMTRSSNLPNSATSSYPPNGDNKISCYNNKKIEAYVDFTPYYQNLEMAKKMGTLPPSMKFN